MNLVYYVKMYTHIYIYIHTYVSIYISIQKNENMNIKSVFTYMNM